MSTHFGQLTMGQLRADSTVYDPDSGLTFHPLSITAIEGSRLAQERINGHTVLDEPIL